MKNRLLIVLAVLILSACEDRNHYQEAVLAHVQKEQQLQKEHKLKDYAVDPEYLAKCVVDTTSNRMPGWFMFDPDRLMAYRNYTKMLNAATSADPKKTLEELRNDFGSAKGLTEAHANFTESMVDCYTAVLGTGEDNKAVQ